jgi:hypothetical protein
MTPPGTAKKQMTTAGPPPLLAQHYSDWFSHKLHVKRNRVYLQKRQAQFTTSVRLYAVCVSHRFNGIFSATQPT